MLTDIPPLKLAWFGVSAIFGGASAAMGYLSRSSERSASAGCVAAGNGLLVGLSIALAASNFAECDPIWMVLGAIICSWFTGLLGVLEAFSKAWEAKENAIAFLDTSAEVINVIKTRLIGTRRTKPSPPQTPPDGDNSSKSPE